MRKGACIGKKLGKKEIPRQEKQNPSKRRWFLLKHQKREPTWKLQQMSSSCDLSLNPLSPITTKVWKPTWNPLSWTAFFLLFSVSKNPKLSPSLRCRGNQRRATRRLQFWNGEKKNKKDGRQQENGTETERFWNYLTISLGLMFNLYFKRYRQAAFSSLWPVRTPNLMVFNFLVTIRLIKVYE